MCTYANSLWLLILYKSSLLLRSHVIWCCSLGWRWGIAFKLLLPVLLCESTRWWTVVLTSHHCQLLCRNCIWVLDQTASIWLRLVDVRWGRRIFWWLTVVCTILMRCRCACTHIWYMLLAVWHLISTWTMGFIWSWAVALWLLLSIVWDLADVREVLVVTRWTWFASWLIFTPSLLTCCISYRLTVVGLATSLWRSLLVLTTDECALSHSRWLIAFRSLVQALGSFPFLY